MTRKSIEMYDPELALSINAIPCEDWHTQERSLTREIMKLVRTRVLSRALRTWSSRCLLASVLAAGALACNQGHDPGSADETRSTTSAPPR